MNKGSVRLLVIIGLVALLVCSWYSLISNTQKENVQYAAYVDTARAKAQLGLAEEALVQYNAAMEYRDSIELRDEVAQFYMDQIDTANYEEFCKQIIEKFPYEAVGYERLAALYKETKAYYTCFSMIESAQKRGIESEQLNAISEELAYQYELVPNSAVMVETYSSAYCAVQRESGLWGFVDAKGNVALSSKYIKVSPFSASGMAAVQMQDGQFALIDTAGIKKSVDAEGREIEDCTACISGKMAVKYDGKYHYCDAAFHELFGAYDVAGAFYCGVAAVQEGGKWAVLDENGNLVTDFIFEDIKLDDKGIAFRGDRALAKYNGEYIVIDTKGKQVGSESWEDADAYNADMLAAVKKNGQWGFIDQKGVMVIQAQYEDARSFANGMAAAKKDGLWGFINTAGEMVIEPRFEDVRDFNSYGSAFVFLDGGWELLRLYKTNY